MANQRMEMCINPIDLEALFEEIDFNDPASVRTVIGKVAQVMTKEPNPVGSGTGMWLKYAADMLEQGLTDMQRHDIKPGDAASALVNAMAMIFGFMTLAMTKDESDFNEVRTGLADTFKEALYTFAIFHPDSEALKMMKPSSVPQIAMRIDEPGTIH